MIIELEGIRKTYRSGVIEFEALRGIDTGIAEGEYVAVVGPSGSGKTTLLAALLSLVDPAERLVLVEDASELRPDHPHVVGLEGRPANVEGAGSIELRALVRQALRMRPDRIVVGEVRGPEALDMLAAMSTGHDGSLCTVHAGGAATFGVGSKRTQPYPSNHSSGQACMSRIDTFHWSPCFWPGRKPTATREGMPTTRAIRAIDEANCSQ